MFANGSPLLQHLRKL